LLITEGNPTSSQGCYQVVPIEHHLYQVYHLTQLLLRVCFACRVLELMPSPLPCCETPEQLLPLLTWAVQLLQNPRVRESDAGARTLQLLVSKYLVGLGWTLTVAPHPAVAAAAAGAVLGASANADQVVAAAAAWLGSLSAQLRSQLMSAHADMAAASRHGLVHGPLLALKYTVEVLPWPMLASSSTHVSVVVSAAAAAACGLSSTAAAGVGCSSHGSSDQQQQQHYQEVVCGPASAVLHCWVADLVALLTTAADLVKPLLSAQVSSRWQLQDTKCPACACMVWM
jgi:hypothetical protein